MAARCSNCFKSHRVSQSLLTCGTSYNLLRDFPSCCCGSIAWPLPDKSSFHHLNDHKLRGDLGHLLRQVMLLKQVPCTYILLYCILLRIHQRMRSFDTRHRLGCWQGPMPTNMAKLIRTIVGVFTYCHQQGYTWFLNAFMTMTSCCKLSSDINTW